MIGELRLFKFGLFYEVINPITKGHKYYLVHFCNHEDGYVYMANFMAEVQRTLEKNTTQEKEFAFFGPGQGQLEMMEVRDSAIANHEQSKVNAIVSQLPQILRAKGFIGMTVKRRLIYAAIVESFTSTVLIKESRRALLAAKSAGLLSFEKDTDSSEVTVFLPKL
jgi:hypothetical protein